MQRRVESGRGVGDGDGNCHDGDAEQYPPVIVRLKLLKDILVPKRVRHGPHESAPNDLPADLSAHCRRPSDRAAGRVTQVTHILSVYSSTAVLKPGMSSSVGHC
jgi:hypothetical protein